MNFFTGGKSLANISQKKLNKSSEKQATVHFKSSICLNSPSVFMKTILYASMFYPTSILTFGPQLNENLIERPKAFQSSLEKSFQIIPRTILIAV